MISIWIFLEVRSLKGFLSYDNPKGNIHNAAKRVFRGYVQTMRVVVCLIVPSDSTHTHLIGLFPAGTLWAKDITKNVRILITLH